MDRRNAVQLVTIAPAIAAAQQHQHAAAAAESKPSAKPKFFNAAQFALVDELSDMIIPTDKHSPGAREAKVAAFIDDYVAEAGAETQRAWTTGLDAVESAAATRHKKAFLKCSAKERGAILDEMAAGEMSPKTELHRFFVRIKTQTLSGYYTSSVGLLKDLQYKGIVPLASFPPCNHPDHERPKAKK